MRQHQTCRSILTILGIHCAFFEQRNLRGTQRTTTSNRYFFAHIGIILIIGIWSIALPAQTPERRLFGFMTAGTKKLPITIKLRQHGKTLTGTYQYVSQGIDIPLKGSLGADGLVTLEEFSDGAIRSGMFTGKYDPSGIDGTWSSPDGKKRYLVVCGTMPELHADEVAGIYKREHKTMPAEIRITALPDDAVNVVGEAFWYGKNDNVHTGNIQGNAALLGNYLVYDSGDKFSGCRLTLTFIGDTLYVTGDTPNGTCGGLNVTFNGTYKRKSAPKPR